MPLIDLTPQEIEIVKTALQYRRQAQADGGADYPQKKENEKDTDQILAKLRAVPR